MQFDPKPLPTKERDEDLVALVNVTIRDEAAFALLAYLNGRSA